MKKIIELGMFVCYLICVGIAYGESELEENVYIYWVEKIIESNDNFVMTLNEDGVPAIVSNIGQGYLVEGSTKQTIYYATADKDDVWGVYELYSGKEAHKLQEANILRVLAYYDSVVYYVEENDGYPRVVSEDQNGVVHLYPSGKYFEDFGLTSDDCFLLDQKGVIEESIIYQYSTTVSCDGKIAYCYENGSAWDESVFSQSIYLLTQDVNETYIGEGTHPRWISNDVLMYTGTDLILRQYNLETGETSYYLTAEGAKISIDSLEPGSRLAVSDDEHVSYIRMQQKGDAVYKLSLDSGEIEKIPGMNPVQFMDAVWVVITE